jgi:hypothetical protein
LPNIQDPQKIGSAITYYRRYSLQSLLALQTDDDDGNKASQPTKVQVENSIPNFLNNSKTLEDLATNYKTLSKDDQKKYAQLTSELKLKLSNTK